MNANAYSLTDDEWCDRYGETPADLARLRHEDTHGTDDEQADEDTVEDRQHEDIRVSAHDPASGVTEVTCEAIGCDWLEVG